MQIGSSLIGHTPSNAGIENACSVEGLTKGQALLTLTAPGKENWTQVMSLYLVGSSPECTVGDYVCAQGVDISTLDVSEHRQFKDPVRRYFETALSAEYIRQAAQDDRLSTQICGLAQAARDYVSDLYISKENLETKLEGLIAQRDALGTASSASEYQVEFISARIKALQGAVEKIDKMRSDGAAGERQLLQLEQKEKLIEMAARGEHHEAFNTSLSEHAAVVRHLQAGGYRVALDPQATLDDDQVQCFLRDLSDIVFSAAHAVDRTAFQDVYFGSALFSAEFRGRQDVIDEWSESLYPGTIKRTAPYNDLMFTQALTKSTDRSVPNLSAGWPTAVTASEVQSFVNSTSGGAFAQLRLLLELGASGIEEKKLFGVLGSALVFLAGGHNLEEVMAGYRIEELQKFMPAVANVNMHSVFGDTTQGSPLAVAFEKAWELNDVVCNKSRVNHEIVRLAQQLSEASTRTG
ncbi:hypothetical protein [Pseudomonas sp. SBB6]|uniref:hypothetical protein n=1 Tax=Pseudomonas sp. SBB6 TaxID=2962032 RepID=UPI0020B7EA3B|nr:hypothetical protein [Pseudomonas sp. SBB6]MCP3749315.1 hypothetical protein [Pseudomonas sp. SBB6]